MTEMPNVINIINEVWLKIIVLFHIYIIWLFIVGILSTLVRCSRIYQTGPEYVENFCSRMLRWLKENIDSWHLIDRKWTYGFSKWGRCCRHGCRVSLQWTNKNNVSMTLKIIWGCFGEIERFFNRYVKMVEPWIDCWTAEWNRQSSEWIAVVKFRLMRPKIQ